MADLNILLSDCGNVDGNQSDRAFFQPILQPKINLTKLQPKKPNTYMYLYGHKFKTIAIKEIPVDQSSCNSFNELNHEYQV